MMNQGVLDAALAYLHELDVRELAPDDALARLRGLRAAYPDRRIEVVWEHDSSGRPRYDVILDAEGGTACLSRCRADAVPFPLRGALKWRESELLAVDGRRVLVHEAMVALDAIWDEQRLLTRLVDLCIVNRRLEEEPVEIGDAALQDAVDRFRARHGLATAEATEQWLAIRGLGLPDLEAWLERELAVEILRRRLVGHEALARFEQHPGRHDRIEVVVIDVADEARGRACARDLRAGADFWTRAQAELASRPGASLSVQHVRREELRALDGELVEAGTILVAQLRGRGPCVVQIREVTPAVWDEPTRTALEQHCFARWLAEARAAAQVEWNWGPARPGHDAPPLACG